MYSHAGNDTIRLAVMGLGNMGVSVAAAALNRGFHVVAMDVDADKVAMTLRGQCVVPEPGITDVFTAARRAGRLTATTGLDQTVSGSDLCFIAVPTPPDEHGDIDYRILLNLLRDLRTPITARSRRYDVVLGSTVFPGVTRQQLLPRLAPLRAGHEFQLAVSPVFLRAGNGMEDYLDPGRVVVGIEGRQQEGIRQYFSRLFPDRQDIWYVDYDTAECIKAIHNTWMSMKVVFANEAGHWCQAVGVDGRKVMDIVLSDTKRLLSKSHLRPGPPYSGPCLPKDALALRRHLAAHDLRCPLFEAVHESNLVNKQRLFDLLIADAQPDEGLGVLGVSFKPDFNELRWSIATELILLARRRGMPTHGYDRAFLGCDRAAFELACRGTRALHELYGSVCLPLEEVWTQARRVFVNMLLDEQEWGTLAALQRRDPRPRTVVDVYGSPFNEALAELPGVTYHGAAWTVRRPRRPTSTAPSLPELVGV